MATYLLGADSSGNGNNWTAVNLDTTDTVADSPTDNFCTLNPLMGNSSYVLSEGNLKVSYASASWLGSQLSTTGMTTGKYYWEVDVNSASGSIRALLGIESSANNYLNSTHIGNLTNSVAIYSVGTNFYVDGSATTDAEWVIETGDTVMFAYDADNGTLWIGKDGTWWNGATSSEISAGTTTNAMTSGLDTSLTWVVGCTVRDGGTVTFNFGQSGFTYTPPTGYLALSTANLPEPTISPADDASPSDYFGTLLWSGDDNATRTVAVGQSGVTGDVNFTPDFTWVKRKNGDTNGSDHMLLDAVRGVGTFNALSSNGAQAEGRTEAGSFWTNFGDIDSFTTDGFVVQKGSDPSHTLEGINQTGGTYVAWNWKAGTSVSGSTGGAGTSKSYTGSVNTTTGFSIIAYEGNGTAGHTIPHHLDSAPEMVIFKNRDGAYGWPIYHESLGATQLIYLNLTNGAVTSDAHVNNTAPTSSVITLHDHVLTNTSPNDYIAYCFHSVEGFSKFGSYTGSSSLPFVYLGFRPAFVMVKRTDSTGSWFIWDTVRETINPLDQNLYANLSNAEASGNELGDALSNGFKVRGTGAQWNASGGTFIYMAFAEMPTKFSLAR